MAEPIRGGVSLANLIVKHNVISQYNDAPIHYPYGATVRELVEVTRLPSHVYPYIAVFVNGVGVSCKHWHLVKPKEHAHVLITLIPQGDNSNKIIGTALVLALSIVATPLAGSALTAAGAGSLVGTAAQGALALGITMVGSMAINALFPPPLEKNRNSSSTSRSAALSITGQSNAATPYGVVQRVYGTYRVYPKVAARSYTLLEGDDQYLYSLYDFGYGPLDVQNIAIGETPVSMFNDIELNLIPSFTSGDQLEIFQGQVDQINRNVALDYNIPFNFQTGPNTQAVMVDINFPVGLMFVSGNTSDRDPLTIEFSVEYKAATDIDYISFQQLRFSFNNNDGISLDIEAFYTLDIGPLHNKYSGRSTQWNGYDQGATVVQLVGQFTSPTIPDGWIIVIANQQYTVVSSAIASPTVTDVTLNRGLTSDVLTGRRRYNNFISDTIEVKAFDNNSKLFRLTRRTLNPFSLSLFMFMPSDGVGIFDIKVTRTSLQINDNNTYLDRAALRTTREITYQSPVNYPTPHTVLELKIRASDQLNGVIDKLNAIATSILPTYNKVSQLWTDLPTNNPAWIFVDILRGVANPKPIADNRIDLDSIADFATWCDRPAPNAANEPYAQGDLVVDYNTTALELAQNVASIGRGSLMVRNGLYSIAVDGQNLTPVQLFSPNNSSSFSGSRQFLATPHGLKVRFVDPETNYQQGEVKVFADGFDDNTATKYENLELFGVTRSTQAWRDGRYFLAQGIKRQEEFKLTVDLENLVCERGDVVRVQHDVPIVGGVASRVRNTNAVTEGGSATEVTLIEPIVIDTLKVNALDIRTLEGVLIRATILALINQYTVSLTAPVAGVYNNDPAVYGEVDINIEPSFEYLVKAIEPQADLAAVLTLTPLEASIYTSDTGPIGPYTPIFTPYNVSGAIPATPVNLEVLQNIQYTDRLPYLTVSIQWSMLDVTQLTFFEIHVLNEGRWQLVTTARNQTQFNFIDNVDLVKNRELVGDTFTFKVLAVNASGNKTPWDEADTVTHTITGDTTPPGDVLFFAVQMLTESMRLTWNAPLDTFDLADYIIRYTPALGLAASWGNSDLLAVVPWDADSLKVEARVGSYMIRARDTSSNISVNAKKISTTIPALLNLNIIQTIEEAPLWIGVKTNTEVLQQTVRLLKTGLNTYVLAGDYLYDTVVNLGAAYVNRVFSEIKGYAFTADALMMNWIPLAIADPIGGKLTEDEWSLKVQISTKDAGTVAADWPTLASVPILSSNESPASPWRDLVGGDYTFQIAYFRLLLISGRSDLCVVATSSKVRVDMPDRIISDNNVVSPAGALNVAYTPPFFARPSLVFADENMLTGDFRVVTNQTATGFTIEFKDAANNPISRTFDWMAQGYGVQTSASL